MFSFSFRRAVNHKCPTRNTFSLMRLAAFSRRGERGKGGGGDCLTKAARFVRSLSTIFDSRLNINVYICRLSGSTTALGTPGNGNNGGGGGGGAGGGGSGAGEGGTAGNGTSGDFLRRSHPLSDHTTVLHPAYRLNYMDHIYHHIQASTHSPNASLHGNCYPSSTQIEALVIDRRVRPIRHLCRESTGWGP